MESYSVATNLKARMYNIQNIRFKISALHITASVQYEVYEYILSSLLLLLRQTLDE